MAAYKIKDLEALTGIKAHTIRIWEKRYGILNPERTDTQIRTYDDEELKFMLNLTLLYNNGFKISKLAEMSSGQIQDQVKKLLFNQIENGAIEELVIGLLEMNEVRMSKTLDSLFLKYELTEVYSRFIIPFLEKMGHLWQVGSIHPGQEHFASNLIRQKIIAAIDHLPTPEEGKESVVLFLPEHEWHELTLLIYHHHLKSNGIKTYYFGQALPLYALEKLIQELNPQALITSWITAVDPENILDYCRQLHRISTIPVLMSGSQLLRIASKLPENFRIIQKLQDLRY